MTRSDFDTLMQEIAAFAADKPLDSELSKALNERYPAGSPTFEKLTRLCQQGIEEGWLCEHEAGGIRYGRPINPSRITHDFSVDVVSMENIAGPHHVHPNGEIDLIMPVEGDALFDGQGAGWMVYGPGSAHSPTVTHGKALVLYLLPQGAIEFTRKGA